MVVSASRAQARRRNAVNTRRLSLAISVLMGAWISPEPVSASATNGVKPGTGGGSTHSTAGSGGNGGGESGSAESGGGKNGSSNGNGGSGTGFGYPGAGGAVGASIVSDLNLSTNVAGGNGSSASPGQAAPGAFHGASGAGGGAGAFVNGSRQISVAAGAQLSGGNGGNGANGRPGCSGCQKGGGGSGGNGLVMLAGGTLTNLGLIQGGSGGGGAAGTLSRFAGGGGGGHGVEGAGLTIDNAGTIRGGAGGARGGGGAGLGEAGAAIHWTGGTNALRLQSGSVIEGALWVGAGATATITASAPVAPVGSWLLLDGAATLDTAGQTLTYSGPITGAGALSKTGTGVLTLSGANTFTGGLWIQAGEVTARLTANLGSGTIRNDAILRFNPIIASTLVQDLQGTGTLIKGGSDRLTLEGAVQLDGAIRIDAGMVQVGPLGQLTAGAAELNSASSVLDLRFAPNAVTLGRLTGVDGSLVNTGTGELRVGDASNQRFDGAISGDGALTKLGSGALTLGGSNSYAGGTAINAGRLIGSAASFGSGAITNGAILQIDQATDADWTNAVTGSGRVDKTGAGTLTLQQAIDTAGGLNVQDGGLVASQQALLGSGPVTVGTSGRITLNLSSDTRLRHIGGDGQVLVDLGGSTRLLTTDVTPAGQADFTGTLLLSNGSLALSGAGAQALAAAALGVNAGGRLLVDAQTGSLGALRTDGGLLRFTPSAADDASTLRPLQVNRTLDLSGTGTVQVDLDLKGASGAASLGSPMALDDGVALALARTATGGQVLGDAGRLVLVGGDGQALGDATAGEIVQAGQRVATTVSSYRLATSADARATTSMTGRRAATAGAGDGLYLIGQLRGITVLADRELVLAAPADADAAGRDLSAPVDGAGGLRIEAGDGQAIRLSAPLNTYAGGTRIVSGTLIGSAGSFGSGEIRNDATLVVEQTLDGSLGNALSGGGGLIKRGAGTLTMTGLHTGSGPVTIEAGTLRAGMAQLGTGRIVNEAVLALDVPRAALLDGRLQGGGQLVKSGDGELTLAGLQQSGAGVRILAGGLVVGAGADAAARLSADVRLEAGAGLSGSGTIAGSAFLPGGAAMRQPSPGASLRVEGDFRMSPGAMLEIREDPTNRNPALIVGGQAVVDGVGLRVDADDGDWAPDSRIELLHAGSVTGQLGAVSTNLAFLQPTVVYAPQSLTLVMHRNDMHFTDFARTPNQHGVADSLALHEATAPAASLLVKLPREEVSIALEELSGGLQAGAVLAPAAEVGQQRQALSRQLRAPWTARGAVDEGRGLWATAYQARSTRVGDGGDPMHGQADGLLAGLDLVREHGLRAGVAVGAGRRRLAANAQDRADARSGTLALYGSLAWQGLRLSGALSYLQARVRTGREVTVGATVASLKASERVRHVEGFIEAGLPGRLPFAQIEPFVQIGRAMSRSGGFQERGDDDVALSGDGARDSRNFGMAGLHLNSDDVELWGATWRLQGTAALQRLSGPAAVTRRVQLPGAGSFVTSAPSGAGTGVMADIGLSVEPRPNLLVSLHAAHGENGASRENSVRMQVSWLF